MSGEYETLDIEEVIARWDEIMERAEAGESFIISVDGQPKVRLEPISPRGRLAIDKTN